MLREGRFLTGDLGFLDAEGYLSVLGRSKEVITGADRHIYPEAIENVLLRPGIQAAVVFGAPVGETPTECALRSSRPPPATCPSTKW